tara:strand:- start:20262 stop:21125 length:864 start_codon:yes stop_codon:yes gene_type:complete
MPNFKPQAGYIGYASVDGTIIRCNDFNINASQEVEWYDHTIGLRDNIASNLFESKGDQGENQLQKLIWRAGVKSYEGTITYYLTKDKADPFFEYARTGDGFDMEFVYFCNIKRDFLTCKVNSWTISATAGDILTVTVNIWCLGVTEERTTDFKYTDVEKLLTWDTLLLDIEGIDDDEGLSTFDMTINNNLRTIYTAGINFAADLNPALQRVGMQEINGNFSLYGDATSLFVFLESEAGRTISFTADSLSFVLNVLFHPSERTGQVGIMTTVIKFDAVWDQNAKGIDL